MLKALFGTRVDVQEIAANIAILQYASQGSTKADGTSELRKLIDRQVAAYLKSLR